MNTKILLGYLLMILGLLLFLYIVLRLMFANKYIGDGAEFQEKNKKRTWSDPKRRSVKVDGDEVRGQKRRPSRPKSL